MRFSKSKVFFLGTIPSANGAWSDLDKTKAIMAMREPSNMAKVSGSLDMVNQLCKFLLDLAGKDKPLRDFQSRNNP